MYRLWLILISFLQLHIASAQSNRKAVFIIVDGIPYDVVMKVATPNLDSIGRITRAYVGGEKGGYSQSPTISAVGYNSLLTGTWANKHNVWDNEIAEPNYNYKNIFRIIKEQAPERKTAVFSSWLDNRTKLVGDGLQAAGNIRVDYHYDSLEHQLTKYPHDEKKFYMHLVDEAVTDSAAKIISTVGPDLTWIYLEYTDDMGHRYGDGEELYGAVQLMDKQVGRIYFAIQERQKLYGEDWEIYVTTDHGRDSATGRDHGGQSFRERSTWIVSNSTKLNDYYYNNVPGIVDILPTLLRHLQINVPTDVKRELDGIPLTGEISIVNAGAKVEDQKMVITWKPVNKGGRVKLWLSTTDNYRKGDKDIFRLMKTVSVASGKATIDLRELKSDFYKLSIEAPYNTLNLWIKN